MPVVAGGKGATIMDVFRRLRTLRDDRGASFVEYSLLLALIAVICLVAVHSFGVGVSDQFSDINVSVAAS